MAFAALGCSFAAGLVRAARLLTWLKEGDWETRGLKGGAGAPQVVTFGETTEQLHGM